MAIVQASPVDCGVYRCTIQNEHGSASTDFCLSPEGESAPGSVPAGFRGRAAVIFAEMVLSLGRPA